MKAIILFLALMFSIAPIRPQSQETSLTGMCEDPSGCPGQASLKEATDDILIQQMAGLLDSIGADTFQDVEAVQYTENENQETEKEEYLGWWVKLDQMKKELPEWMDEVGKQMLAWVKGWAVTMAESVAGWSTMSAWVKGWAVTMAESVAGWSTMEDWFHSRGIQLPHFTSPGDDKTTILGVIASTLLLLHFINLWIVRSGREKDLIARLAEMDRKLFTARNEALIAKKDGDTFKQGQFDEIVKEKDTQIVESRLALERALADCEQVKDECGQAVQAWKEKCEELNDQVEECNKEKLEAVKNFKQSEEMMEEVLQYDKDRNKNGQSELLEMVEKLQDQLKRQNNLLSKYEPMLKEKEKTIRELGKESKQLKVDEANARLELDKVKKELIELNAKVDAASKSEADWKSLSDLLQSQVDEKMASEDNLLKEMGDLKSKLATFETEVEAKEEQIEELNELVLVLESKKPEERLVSNDGWDLGEDCDLEDAKEVAKLRVHAKKMEESKVKMERDVTETKTKWENIKKELENLREENRLIQTTKQEAVKESEDAVRKLDVLVEFFNKKETELQKELGIQYAKFDNLSTDAETANKRLIATMTELEASQATLKIIKRELEEQEVSLKASVASEEKKAHENWVAARQAERKLGDLQGELGLLRNRLTAAEENNYALVQCNEQLQKVLGQQLPPASDSEVSTMNGGQNGYSAEPAQNGLPLSETYRNGIESVQNGIESISENGNFNNAPPLLSKSLFSEIKPVDQSILIKPSLPPLPGLKSFTSPPSHLPGLPSSFTSPPSHLPGLPSLPGSFETNGSLPPLFPSHPGMMALANTTIPTMDSHSSYRDYMTDDRPPSHEHSLTIGRPPSNRDHMTDGRPPSNGPRSRRKYSPDYDRVSSSTSHYRDSSSRMSYEGDSPAGSGRHGSPDRSRRNSDRSRHGSPDRSCRGSPDRSRHGSPDRTRDGRHSRGERRSYHKQSPTRSYHGRDRGLSSRDGSSDKYHRGESGRKKAMGSNGKSFNGTGWGKGYENPHGYTEGSQLDRNEMGFKDEQKKMGRTHEIQNAVSDRTSSPIDHTDQFRNLI